jgi:uncharacterized LabA/DUF88 family protein
MRIPERFVGAQQLSVDTTDDLGAVAVFFDFENIVLGVRDEFRVSTVIDALNERGDVMVRRAYADWGRYRRYQRQFLEQGVAMVFLPSYGIGDKNRTDTAICVDAMEILFTRPHIDTFVIASGDSDFGVLAHRLRDHGKRVVGISAKSAASDILVKICHEFIFYESLVGQRVQGVSMEEAEERVRRAVQVCVDQHGPRFRASVIKDRMRKQDPTFSERNYGASSFTRFLRNFDHLVELLDGGMVQVNSALAPNGAPQTRPADALPSKPPVLAPEIEAEAAENVWRAILLASPDGESVSLARLKDALGEVAPDFDEMALGFRTFTRFLKTFPQVVEVERDRNRVRAVDGGRGGDGGRGTGGDGESKRPSRTQEAATREGDRPARSKQEPKQEQSSQRSPRQASAPADGEQTQADSQAPAERLAAQRASRPAPDVSDDVSKSSRSRAERRDARRSVKPIVPTSGVRAAADATATPSAPSKDANASSKGPKQSAGQGHAKAEPAAKSDEARPAANAPKGKTDAAEAKSGGNSAAKPKSSAKSKASAKPKSSAKPKAADPKPKAADAKAPADAKAKKAPAGRTRRKKAAADGAEG